jgi:protein-tyrosine phosphatase
VSDADIAAPPSSPLNNLRDLAGIPVAGGVIAPGRLFRSDDVSTVPDAQARELYARGIRTIVDLRSDAEADHTGRGPLGGYDITYHRLSLLHGGADPDEFLRHLQEGTATAATVGGYYASTLVAESTTIAEGIRIVADAPGGALFHCAAGKDRTGVFAAAVLSVLGADDEAIAVDYARSSVAVPRIMARVSASIGHLMGESDEFFQAAAARIGPVSPLLGAEHDAMLAMLATLDEREGGAGAVLRRAGLNDEVVARLRARVVE